jgi:uncharacterized protein with ParB-like and HNH nuclease domain
MGSGIGISANEDTVESVLSRNYKYCVPDYQRQYSWTEDQWMGFWNDLMALTDDKQHFLGSLVVIERNGGLNDLHVLEIVDGQQRLTTISLLLVVLREQYRDGENDSKAERIDDDYLWEKDLDENRHQNLELSTFDNDTYLKILRSKWEDIDDGNIKKAIEFFVSRVNGLSDSEIDELYKRLLRSVTLVSIECDGEQSAFRLFETLNDRGLELSAIDLMKNYVFSVAARDPNIDYGLIRDNWQRIVDQIIPNLNKPSRFFRHYIMSSPVPDWSDNVSDYKLYDVFQTIISDQIPDTELTVEEYVQDLAFWAEIYIEIIDCEITRYSPEANKEINKKLRHLEEINSVQARTLLLRIIREFDNPNRVIEAFQVLEIFLIRWKVANYATGTELDRINSRLCSEIFDNENPIKNMKNIFDNKGPSDDEFRAGIENKRMRLNNRTKYMLSMIEHHHYNGDLPDNLFDTDTEHIAPRSALSAKKYNSWVTTLNTTETVFEQHRDLLGNLTLLESDKNVRVGANPFDEKRSEYQTSKFKMTQSISESYDRWGIDTIKNRTEDMADIAVSVWSF